MQPWIFSADFSNTSSPFLLYKISRKCFQWEGERERERETPGRRDGRIAIWRYKFAWSQDECWSKHYLGFDTVYICKQIPTFLQSPGVSYNRTCCQQPEEYHFTNNMFGLPPCNCVELYMLTHTDHKDVRNSARLVRTPVKRKPVINEKMIRSLGISL